MYVIKVDEFVVESKKYYKINIWSYSLPSCMFIVIWSLAQIFNC